MIMSGVRIFRRPVLALWLLLGCADAAHGQKFVDARFVNQALSETK
jgi:hypothetical protein